MNKIARFDRKAPTSNWLRRCIAACPPLLCLLLILPESSRATPLVPRGVFSLGYRGKPWAQAALENPDVTGMALRYNWADLEPNEGLFNWSFVDSEIARAAAAGKIVLLRIMSMNGRPAWVDTAVTAAGGKFFTFVQHGVNTSIPVFWDPTFLQKKTRMISALGQHYSSNPTVAIVSVSFANATTEDWNVPHTPEYVAEWLSLGYTSDLLLSAGNEIIGTTMEAFPGKLVTLAVQGNGASLDVNPTYVASSAIDTARAIWPGRLIVQVNSLSAITPEAPGPANSGLELLYDSGPDIAFQTLAQCFNDSTYRMNGGIPADPAAVLTRAVDAAATYSPNYIEIYQGDVVNLPAVISYARSRFVP